VAAVAAAVAEAAEAVVVAEAALVARDAAAVAVCPGVLAASADRISLQLLCQNEVATAGLDNIDPAVLCLADVPGGKQANSRLKAEPVSEFVDKRQHAG
jgi:hypothetical protein